jgi:TRAP-type C4-dicarboxylate transport system permease small subunit
MLKLLGTKIFNTSRRLNYISGIALTLMMCLVFINVLLRIVWRPILGTYEFTALLASVTISFGLAHCAAQKGHVAISLFTERLSRRMQGICEAIVGAIGASLFSVLCWQTILQAFVVRRSGEVSFTTEVPFWPFILGVAFGFLMLAIVNLIDFLNSFKKVAK